MALDSSEYGDPLNVAIKHEAEWTCVGCGKRVKAADRVSYKCAFNINGYPERTKDTCKYWIKRQRQPGHRY